ncbi:MAG: tetratricopeptide repeat protein [Myxococcales bacterium]|nr:tetratricopeptide repeat protein [Myxococcales bacterium]
MIARRGWLQLVAIAALALLAHVNTFDNSFHLDDFYRVRDNPDIRRVSPISRHFVDPRTMSTLEKIAQYRPLLPLSLSIDYAAAGGRHSLRHYHATNLALLMLVALLCWLLVRQLLARAGVEVGLLPLGVAAIVAVHPVSGILVNYICARDLLLAMVGLLGTLCAYLAARGAGPTTRGRLMWGLSLLALALALLSKTNAAVAPALIVLLELTIGGESPRSARPWLRALPAALVVAAFFAWTHFGLGFSDAAHVTSQQSPWTYAATQARLHLLHYLRNALWPLALAVDPHVQAVDSFDLGAICGAALIIASLLLAARWRRERPLEALCIAGYWVAMAPTSSLLPLHAMAVDYRPFVASPFLWLFVALLLRRVLAVQPLLRAGACALALLYFGAVALANNRAWRDDRALWEHAVAHGGGALAHHNLAVALGRRDELPRRVALLRQALALAPRFVLAHVNVCRALVGLGKTREGLAHCTKAVGLDPRAPLPRYWVALTLAQLGDKRAAARHYAVAAELDARNIEYQYAAARALQVAGDEQRSLAPLRRLMRLSPRGYKDAGYLLGWAYQKLGQRDRAIAAYRAFLSAQPKHVQARFNLAFALMKRGDCKAAVPEFQRVLSLKPSYQAARLHLSSCVSPTRP